jgi:type I restriction enzyme S subunit
MPYIKHFLRSLAFMRQIDQLKTGTAIEHYGPTHLGEVKIPLPSFGRQQELASEMDEERKKSLGMTALLQRQIEVLAERRQAVITAAVTGALPVPGVAA